MRFKTELFNALQLFSLLCLLFWSFTWNSSSFSFSRHSAWGPEVLNVPESVRLSIPALKNQHSVLLETFAAVKQATKRVASSSRESIPPFKEWKAKEMTKYEKSSNAVIPKNQNKSSRRKLNYASSKCGAKILASNPEAKHKLAILSEKADEYMLNPCRVRTWFIIELCDTIEITQVELSNYELYSSSPKLFSVFWSEIYPTLIWRFLGTFEGKDQRTMQTFDINMRNLGKFIKVIIYSHYGKEHYCPLSVFRVLGYSMVQEFEDIESVTSIPPSGISNESETSEEKEVTSQKPLNISQTKIQELKNLDNFTSNLYSLEVCSLFINHCFDTAYEISENRSLQNTMCQFISVISLNLTSVCSSYICPKYTKIPIQLVNTSNKADPKANASASIVENENIFKDGWEGRNSKFSEFYDNSKDHTIKPSHRMEESSNISVPQVVKDKDLNTLQRNSSKTKASVNEESIINVTKGEESSKRKNNQKPTEDFLQKKCICENNVVKTETLDPAVSGHDKRNIDVLSENEDSVDSAGLLQKDSVLIKLTSRIKASELDLDLINKYLQELSQSYRHQMDDMQTLFNHTVRAISVASEKAAKIDNKQQVDINMLASQVNSLNRKTAYLTSGQSHMLIRVMELHGFFLIMEIIIISTIFTIFLNIFNRKNTHYFGIETKSFRRLNF